MPQAARTTSQVFLASRTEEENHILRRKLQPLLEEFAPLQFVSMHPQGLVATVDRRTAAVILNYNDWVSKEGAIVEELRATGFGGSIILMAKTQIAEAIKDLRTVENVVFVEKPFEPRDLLGIVRKLLSDRDVYQRIHRRYATSQDAEVEFAERSDHERKLSRLANLSKGGAYLEFMTMTPVRIGEHVRLKLELKELNRTYTMPAKVVWMQKATPNGGTGVGVEFVGPGDVHRRVLGSF